MATLKELMGDLTRGDGRRFFDLTSRIIYEPIYVVDGLWYGLSSKGNSFCFLENGLPTWEIDQPAKPKKKVKMYSPVYMNNSGIGYFMEDGWSSSKNDFDSLTINPIVGWQEMEVEVDE